MKIFSILVKSIFFICMAALFAQAETRFKVSVDPTVHQTKLTGRVIIALASDDKVEPRLAVRPNGLPIFGVDAEGLAPGQAVVVDQTALGHPVDSIVGLPAGDYFVQAIINIYTECHRSDGHVVWVHLDRDGLPFNASSGNLYSDVKKVHLDAAAGYDIELRLTHVIAEPKPPADTEWLKHVRIRSKLLSDFWGQPMYLGATVLLPKGYAEHEGDRYPVVYAQGFLGGPPFSFDLDPATLKQGEGLKRMGLQSGYEFYQSWISEKFPRFLAVTFLEPSPFFPDGYGINSANEGPYGDAIVNELIPYIEGHFRAIAKPYARVLEGASTGGWESLALQLHHPDFFGGAWVYYPDPIDFRRYQMIDIYGDDNAFTAAGQPWAPPERPMRRTDQGQVVMTVRQLTQFEEVLGTKLRGGYQFAAWEAIYGPVGADGYPRPLWDRKTGKIDHDVAVYMRDHGYDLRYYAEKNWADIGPKIAGKLHFMCGDMDNFYLNLAVYSFEDFATKTSNPAASATFEYGRPMKGHWWHPKNFADVLRDMAVQINANAPTGERQAWNES
jgi:S-formylglutathione hydrolase FrmB